MVELFVLYRTGKRQTKYGRWLKTGHQKCWR